MIGKLMLGCLLAALLLSIYFGPLDIEYEGLVGLVGLVGLGGRNCHSGLQRPHPYLATKSPYLPPQHTPHPQSDESSCEALQLWMVIRHGTRNPSAKVIEKMAKHLPPLRHQLLQSHQQGKGSLCKEAVEELGRWTPADLSSHDEKKLLTQGQEELQGIGTRFRQRFPSLFTPYSNTTYKFKYTKTERTAASANFFVKGLFGNEEASQVKYPEPLHADPILRFYKGCERWKKEVDKNPLTYVEREKFEQSEMFESMVRKLNSRLGLEGKDGLRVEIVEIIYMTCAFETAWKPASPSPWCHIFDLDDLEIMQYRQDLEYYWVDGYGVELTYLQACPAVKDLLLHFSYDPLHYILPNQIEYSNSSPSPTPSLIEKVMDPSKGPSVIAYFTHSGTTLKLLSRFGLFNDTQPLLHTNFDDHQNRKWKTSHIDKFATNLAFGLYNCSGEHRVGLLFNEQQIPIPGCGTEDDSSCSLADFTSIYHSIANNCDMAKLCQL